jgi:hypothetical protein
MDTKPHSGVDPKGHGPDGPKGGGYACDPLKAYSGVDDRAAMNSRSKQNHKRKKAAKY